MAERLTHAHEGDLAVFLIGMTMRCPGSFPSGSEASARQRLGPRAQVSRSPSGTRTSTGLLRDTSSGETA